MLPLKTTLLINGASSGAAGAGLILFAAKIAELFGVTNSAPFIEVGVFLLLFAAMVLFTAIRKEQNRGLIRFITFLDILWVLASVILVIEAKSSLSVIGIIAILAVVVWVGLMAYLQNKGIRQMAAKAIVSTACR